MSYKIVETVERGKRVLSIVPEKWEDNGVLKWPRKNYDKLKLNPNSRPDQTWLPMPCRTKRIKLKSYDSAEIEINCMSDVTDTEIEEESPVPTSKNIFNFDFNNLARSSFKEQDKNKLCELTSSAYIAPENPAAISVEESGGIDEETPNVYNVEELTPVGYNVEESSAVHILQETSASELQNVYLVTDTCETNLRREESQVDIAILSQKIDNLTKIAYELQNNQKNIMLKLASVTTSVEEYMKKITYKDESSITSTNFDVINDVKMLQEFESSLQNPVLKEEIMKKLSVVCSRGKGKGANNAYVLVDVMFTRKFMNECSWSGGSRNDSPKTCFKSYVHTINVFFEILHNTDDEFNKADCEIFLKKVLRHSAARNASQNLRCSAIKRRPKKDEDKEVDKENVNPVA